MDKETTNKIVKRKSFAGKTAFIYYGDAYDITLYILKNFKKMKMKRVVSMAIPQNLYHVRNMPYLCLDIDREQYDGIVEFFNPTTDEDYDKLVREFKLPIRKVECNEILK